jgi:hypothetical protein
MNIHLSPLSSPSSRNCLQYIVLPSPEGPERGKIFGTMLERADKFLVSIDCSAIVVVVSTI